MVAPTPSSARVLDDRTVGAMVVLVVAAEPDGTVVVEDALGVEGEVVAVTGCDAGVGAAATGVADTATTIMVRPEARTPMRALLRAGRQNCGSVG